MTFRARRRLSELVYGLYHRRLKQQIAAVVKPRHVAMIIDGNRRWAKQLGLDSPVHGHRAGAAKMLEFLRWCDENGIEVVTLYLLSNDNLVKRDAAEIEDLKLVIADLATEIAGRDTWRVNHVGSLGELESPLRTAIERAERESAAHPGLVVNLAVGYGGRHEIVEAMRRIVAKHHADGRALDELAETLTPELIGAHLYTGGQPDPDLVIRTSGEQRISDFMVWQSAHSEFYFVEALGPDLREVDFLRALRDYGTRTRRYGA